MRKQLIYDLPVRVFHFLFAGLFIAAFLIVKTVDDDSPSFSYHMLAGLLLGSIVILRLIWGIVGTKHARFKSFALRPRDILNYFLAIISGDKRKSAGHNPASSWAALLMFALALGLALTGYLMVSGGEEAFEDIHELMANAFLVVTLLHVAGVALHALRHQDGIFLTMVTGEKSGVPSGESIARSRPLVALLFLSLFIGFAALLATGFDSTNGSLNLFGSTWQLSETDD